VSSGAIGSLAAESLWTNKIIYVTGLKIDATGFPFYEKAAFCRWKEE